ncbi:MAG: tetratricopeptide repeat protein [Woeseiaceae bacterium]|nr:tetratricopeptide repeat protein [Woeseiaceae bacterium]
MEQLFLPQWVSTLAVIFFVVGFPVAMFLSWTFDLTSEGIRRTNIKSGRGTASIALSMLLLVAGTAGLFLLIRPAMESGDPDSSLDIPPNSVAVLPFDNASRSIDDEYLSLGLSDALRDQLGRISELRIAARSSSMAIGRLGGGARSSSEKLGVRHLVEGSLRRQGDVLHVSVQLIDGASGLSQWNETYERGPSELVSLQQEIMERVVKEILPGSQAALPASPTRSSTANEALLLGRYYEQQVRDSQEVDEELLLKAIGHYREAVELDPESALAHSRLAGALLYLGDLDAAEAPIHRALSLDPSLSEAQQTIGLFYYARGLPEALANLERAVELDPDNADALTDYAFARWMRAKDEGVVELYRLALDIDRHSLSRYAALGLMLGQQGRPNEARELIDRILERFDGPDSYRVISQILANTGELDTAIAWAIRARNSEPGNSDHVEWLAELYTDIGDLQTAMQLVPDPSIGLLIKMRRYDELIPIAEELMIDEPDNALIRYFLAYAYHVVENFEGAIWVLSSTGLPESVMTTPRISWDWEGFFTLMNSSLGMEEVETARGLAEWFYNKPDHHNNIDWVVESLMACSLSVLGRTDESLDMLELVKRSPRLMPRHALEDTLCFRRLADESRYQAIIDHFEARRAELRKRLPATLKAFDVVL